MIKKLLKKLRIVKPDKENVEIADEMQPAPITPIPIKPGPVKPQPIKPDPPIVKPKGTTKPKKKG